MKKLKDWKIKIEEDLDSAFSTKDLKTLFLEWITDLDWPYIDSFFGRVSLEGYMDGEWVETPPIDYVELVEMGEKKHRLRAVCGEVSYEFLANKYETAWLRHVKWFGIRDGEGVKFLHCRWAKSLVHIKNRQKWETKNYLPF